MRKKCRQDDETPDFIKVIMHYNKEAGVLDSYTVESWSLLVLHSGKLIIKCDDAVFYLYENEMLLLPVNKMFIIEVVSSSFFTTILFYDHLSYTNKILVEDLLKGKNSAIVRADLMTLKLHPHIMKMFDFEQTLYEDDQLCPLMSRLFVNQLFVLIRNNYEEEELNNFFAVMKMKNMDFRNFIMLNYENKNIKALADACNMSIPTFNRYFRNNFGESALQWMNKRKADRIYEDIAGSLKSFTEIADDHNFSTSAYLTSFCRRYFNLTPYEIRKRFKDDASV